MYRAIPLVFVSFLSLIATSQTVLADQLGNFNGPVILTVSGNLEHSNSPQGAQLNRQMLESLPQYQFTTVTPWTDGVHQYQGVLLSELLGRIGANGNTLVAHGLNDYYAEIDLQQIKGYPILLAMKSDGETMRVRDKGPIWLLYPMSDYPELDSSIHHASMVWQLNRLEIR